jgi:hypothetical protein
LFTDCSKFILSWYLKEWKENLFVVDGELTKQWGWKDQKSPPVFKVVTVPYDEDDRNGENFYELCYTESELKLCTALFEGDETRVLLTDLSVADIRLSLSSSSILFAYEDYIALGASPKHMMQTLIKLIEPYGGDLPIPSYTYETTLLRYAYRLCKFRRHDLARICFEAGADVDFDTDGVFEAMVTDDTESLQLYMDFGFDLDDLGEGPREEFLFLVEMEKRNRGLYY